MGPRHDPARPGGRFPGRTTGAHPERHICARNSDRKSESPDIGRNIEEFGVNEPLDEPHVVLSGLACHLLAPMLAPLVKRRSPTDPELVACIKAMGRCGEAYRALVLRRAREDRELANGWLTTAEAAERAGVSRRAIQRRAQRGTVASVRLGKWLFIDPASLANAKRTSRGEPGAHSST
jgi:excisionase family DNA binding protein